MLEVSVDERVVDRLLEAVRCSEQQASFADPDNPSRQIQFRYHLIEAGGDSAQVDFTGPDGIKRRVTVRRGQLNDTGIRVAGSTQKSIDANFVSNCVPGLGFSCT